MLGDNPLWAVLPATNLERAKKFYTEVVGLKHVEDPKAPKGHIMLTAGQNTGAIVYERPVPTKAEHTVAGFAVKDLEKEVEELRAKGVRFEEYDFPGLKTVNGIATLGGYKSAWFKDTESNIISINEM